MQTYEDKPHGLRKIHQLRIEPSELVASLGKRCIAVECDSVYGLPKLHRIPAPIAHVGEGSVPVVQGLVRIAMEFMVAEGGIYV